MRNVCDHEWERGETLDSIPQIYTRYCVKCGQAQTKRGAGLGRAATEWTDNGNAISAAGPRASRLLRQRRAEQK